MEDETTFCVFVNLALEMASSIDLFSLEKSGARFGRASLD